MVNTLTIQPPLDTKQETSRDQYDNDTSKQDDGIFQYLPIDILKSVHRILQSQPASIEGKLYFLKTFEKILMSEIGKICPHNSDALNAENSHISYSSIESRLTATMAPNRKIRGVEYYGHDDHDHEDHSLGFPSIEGTLLAISFLTFAVYLVRLVMVKNISRNADLLTTRISTSCKVALYFL